MAVGHPLIDHTPSGHWRVRAIDPQDVCTGAGVYASSHEPVISGLGIEWAGRGYCHGTLVGALVGVGVILSYLVLFVSFYLVTVPHAQQLC
jgi:hypothetical protein